MQLQNVIYYKDEAIHVLQHHAMKTYWRSGGEAPYVNLGIIQKVPNVNLCIIQSWVVSFTIRSPYRLRIFRHAVDRRLGATQSPFERCGA